MLITDNLNRNSHPLEKALTMDKNLDSRQIKKNDKNDEKKCGVRVWNGGGKEIL